MAAFNEPQVQQFAELWERENGGAQGRLARQLQIPAVKQVCQNPFLLTLVCWVAERHELSDELTRTQLYDRMLRDVLGLPLEGAGVVDERRAGQWLPVLAEVAWRWFNDCAGRRPIARRSIGRGSCHKYLSVPLRSD